MANIKSQIKRNRQNDKKRLRNRVFRGTARVAVKNARTTIGASAPESKEALKSAISALDKAVEQGVLHKNNAARRKSRLSKAFNKMEPVSVEVKSAVEEPIAVPEPKKAATTKKVTKTATKKISAEKKPAAKAKAKKAATTKKAAVKK